MGILSKTVDLIRRCFPEKKSKSTNLSTIYNSTFKNYYELKWPFEDAYQYQEFEQSWDELPDLSAEEKELFPNTEEMNTAFHFNFDQDDLNNPMMTSVALDQIQTRPSNDFCADMDLGEATDIFNIDLLNSGNIDNLEVILDDPEAVGSSNPVPIVIEEVQAYQTVPNQTQNLRPAEDIFEIHSYCSQKSQVEVVSSNPPEVDAEPVSATPKVYKSKGKVGPPTVQKENTEVLKKVQNGRVTKRLRKPVKKKKKSESENDENDSDYEEKSSTNKSKKSVNSSSSTSKSTSAGNRKVKLYEQEPFSDPEMERCRQNAINAKISRDRKNKEKNAMTKEMAKLRRENQDLKKKNQKYRTRLTDFESRLQLLETFIRSNPRMDQVLKASGNADFGSVTSINKNQFDEIFSSNSASSSEEAVDEPIIYYD